MLDPRRSLSPNLLDHAVAMSRVASAVGILSPFGSNRRWVGACRRSRLTSARCFFLCFGAPRAARLQFRSLPHSLKSKLNYRCLTLAFFHALVCHPIINTMFDFNRETPFCLPQPAFQFRRVVAHPGRALSLLALSRPLRVSLAVQSTPSCGPPFRILLAALRARTGGTTTTTAGTLAFGGPHRVAALPCLCRAESLEQQP
jgi:hypothetical protein